MLDLATVVFARELPMLELQARSVDRFLAPDGIGSVRVIVNDVDEAGCLRAVEAMRPAWGRFADRLDPVGAEALFALRPDAFGPRGLGQRSRHWFTRHRGLYPMGRKGGWRGNRGWALQQAAKLAIARRADASHLLLLDAKNHLIRDVSVASFVGPTGRARCDTTVPNASQRRYIEASFRRFGAAPPPPDVAAPRTVTPFCVARELLISCLEALEREVGPVESFFARKKTAETEFMLLYAHAARDGDWRAAFDSGLIPAATIFRNDPPDRIDAVLGYADSGEAEMLGVHASQIGKLTADQRGRLRSIWAARGLPPLPGV